MGCSNEKMTNNNAASEGQKPVPRDSVEEVHASSKSIKHAHFQETSPEDALKHDGDAHASNKKGNALAMKKVVDTLYNKILSNPDLKPYYANTDMEHLTNMQQQLMAYVFGGNELVLADNPDFDLRAIHMEALVDGKLSYEHWEAFVNHFEETLNQLSELPQETRDSALAWIRSTRNAFRPPTQEEADAWHAKHTAPAAKCPFAH